MLIPMSKVSQKSGQKSSLILKLLKLEQLGDSVY